MEFDWWKFGPASKGTLHAPAVKWVEILQYRGKKVYFAGTSVGLFSTTFLNGAKTVWMQEADNDIGNVPVDMIKVRQADTTVFIATHGAGVYNSRVTIQPVLPEIIALESPINDAKGVVSSTTLIWKSSANARYYEVQVARDEQFSDIVFTSEALDAQQVMFNTIEGRSDIILLAAFAVSMNMVKGIGPNHGSLHPLSALLR